MEESVTNVFHFNPCQLTISNIYSTDVTFKCITYTNYTCPKHGDNCGDITFLKDGKKLGVFCCKCYNELINTRTEEYFDALKTLICEATEKKN